MIWGWFYDVDSCQQPRKVHQIPFETTTEMLNFSNFDLDCSWSYPPWKDANNLPCCASAPKIKTIQLQYECYDGEYWPCFKGSSDTLYFLEQPVLLKWQRQESHNCWQNAEWELDSIACCFHVSGGPAGPSFKSLWLQIQCVVLIRNITVLYIRKALVVVLGKKKAAFRIFFSSLEIRF